MSDRPSTPRPRLPGHLSRRNMLYGGGLVVVSATASGCGLFSTDPDDDSTGGDKGPEAPMLAARVEAGELPPVAERLPVNPLVVEPNDEIGAYGGTWRTTITGDGDGPWLFRTIGYESLLRWPADWSSPLLNVAESFEVSDDGLEFTIVLREGHKWSDGELLTTEDVQFAYDILTNTEINQQVEASIVQAGEPAELEIVDELTFIVRFSTPNGLFEYAEAGAYSGDRLVSHPEHYLRDFLPEFNPNADAEAQEAGYEGWVERLNTLGTSFSPKWNNPDLPTLNPWIAVEPLLGATSAAVFQRNPYYYKVDPEGSQLPYLDEVRFQIIEDDEAKLTRAIAGDFDFHTRHIVTLDNRPVIAENQESGDYHILELEGVLHNEMTIMLNLHHRDEAVRELYQNRDFRVALSHAIDRERLVNAVFARQGEPYQAAPVPSSRFYDEEMAKQYTEHDPDQANQILDDAGFDDRDGDGFRLRPDGERVSVRISYTAEFQAFWTQALELVKEDWEAVGVETILDNQPREQFENEKTDRNQDATVWVGEGGHNDALTLPRQYFAFDFESHFGSSWAQLWRGGEFDDPDDVPPPQPEPLAEQQRLYDQLSAEPDEAARDDLMRQILAIAKEQFWVIGTVRVDVAYGIVHNRFKNVGDFPTAWNSAVLDDPACRNPEQFYIDPDAPAV